MPDHAPRTSLTKRQRLTAAGADLISLCQTVTEDGSLEDVEISALREWLYQHRNADLPAIAFLTRTVESILADGRVTKEERDSLYQAIEAVLPPDVRRGAVAKRRSVAGRARLEDRQQRAVEAEKSREERREERERNRKQGYWNFMVAGVRYDGRPALIMRYVQEDDVAFLARDHGNRFSRHAVEVRTKGGVCVGYVPEEYACEMAPLLDQGYRQGASFARLLTEGRSPIPVVIASPYLPEANVEGTVLPGEVPRRA